MFKSGSIKKSGEVFGFLAGYFLFTTVLYFLFLFLNKIPDKCSYFDIISLTIFITLMGLIIKKLLK